MRNLILSIFLLYSLLLQAQDDCVKIEPSNRQYGLNIYYPLLVPFRTFDLYEKIENVYTFSKAPKIYEYEFSTQYDGKVWRDSATGLIKIVPDSVGSFTFTMDIIFNDSLLDRYFFGMTVNPIPAPAVKFYEIHENYLTSEELVKAKKVVCYTRRFPYYISYHIEGFSITIITEKGGATDYEAIGDVLSTEMKGRMDSCVSGDKIVIHDVIAY